MFMGRTQVPHPSVGQKTGKIVMREKTKEGQSEKLGTKGVFVQQTPRNRNCWIEALWGGEEAEGPHQVESNNS